MKKILLLVVIIGCVLFISKAYLSAHEAGNNYPTTGVENYVSPEYSESAAEPGGYYNELWEAGEVFHTAPLDEDITFNITQAPANTGASSAAPFRSIGTYKGIPAKAVVTKWKVTGHVHFPN
jgi:hypothetical protein